MIEHSLPEESIFAQALALMDHPNIAKVFDAGTTSPSGGRQPPEHDQAPGTDLAQGANAPRSGRPYFVMELVRGIPITEYCDQNQLMPRERLELFVPVCQAVQHAHQKGIIHRDIKLSNVIVTPPVSPPSQGGGQRGGAGAQDHRLRHRQSAGPAID